MGQTIRFAKMQGIGNDFVAVHTDWLSGLHGGDIAEHLCDRHFGIGADGLITIGASTHPDCAFDFTMFNPDGTPDMCGNGLRCAALLAYKTGLLSPSVKTFNAFTPSGVHACEWLDTSQDYRTGSFRIDLGAPVFEPSKIPVDPKYLNLADGTVYLHLDGAEIELIPVNTGSTHAVVFVPELPNDETFDKISPQIGLHEAFPERTSVMWATSDGLSGFNIRIWERGVGETLGCGTGACAVAAAVIKTGLGDYGVDIPVTSKGGTLSINWTSVDGTMLMTGPATLVYDGEFGV